jgi:hypothetical protein
LSELFSILFCNLQSNSQSLIWHYAIGRQFYLSQWPRST